MRLDGRCAAPLETVPVADSVAQRDRGIEAGW